MATGFVVEIGEYVADAVDFRLLATSARAFFDPATGQSRGRCAFVPAVAPGIYLKIEDHLVGETILKPADSNDWAFGKIPLARLHSAPSRSHSRFLRLRPGHGSRAWDVGFEPRWNAMMLSRECTPDDKSR